MLLTNGLCVQHRLDVTDRACVFAALGVAPSELSKSYRRALLFAHIVWDSQNTRPELGGGLSFALLVAVNFYRDSAKKNFCKAPTWLEGASMAA